MAGRRGDPGVSIPCPSGAEAASGSASGFLSRCCPGLQILRFLPMKQTHTREETDGGRCQKEGKGHLVSGTEPPHNYVDTV